MAKSVQEVLDEIRIDSTPKEEGGRVSKTFSRSAFDKLAKALINEPTYLVDVATVKGGVLEISQVEPVALYRKGLQLILQDFGVDKQESARVLDSRYEIRSVDGFYELASELIYQTVNAGRKFDFIQREDFTGSLTLNEVAEETKKYKRVREKGYTGPEEIFEVNTKAHKQLKAKSKAGSWLKKRVN